VSNIKVNDLLTYETLGADLFSDSESFMRDLQEDDLNIQGGITPFLIASSYECAFVTYMAYRYYFLE
jgi:hypothetical protein